MTHSVDVDSKIYPFTSNEVTLCHMKREVQEILKTHLRSKYLKLVVFR